MNISILLCISLLTIGISADTPMTYTVTLDTNAANGNDGTAGTPGPVHVTLQFSSDSPNDANGYYAVSVEVTDINNGVNTDVDLIVDADRISSFIPSMYISSSSDNALWLDQVTVKRDGGTAVFTNGDDNNAGWCFSTDPSDNFSGISHTGCPQCWKYLTGDEAEVGTSDYYCAELVLPYNSPVSTTCATEFLAGDEALSATAAGLTCGTPDTTNSVCNYYAGDSSCHVVTADKIDISFNVIVTIDFPQLTAITNNLYLTENLALTTINLPELTTVGGQVRIEDDDALVSFTLPKLATITGTGDTGDILYIRWNDVLQYANFPVLNSYTGDYIAFDYNPALLEVSLPELTTIIGGYISVQSNGAVVSVSFPKLTNVDLYVIVATAQSNLVSVDFSSLTTIGETLLIHKSTQPALADISLCGPTLTVNGGAPCSFPNDASCLIGQDASGDTATGIITGCATTEEVVDLTIGACSSIQTSSDWSWSGVSCDVDNHGIADVCIGACLQATLAASTTDFQPLFAIQAPGTLVGHTFSISGKTPPSTGATHTVTIIPYSGALQDNGVCSGVAFAALNTVGPIADNTPFTLTGTLGTEHCWQIMVEDLGGGRRRGTGGDFTFDALNFGNGVQGGGDPHFSPLNGDPVIFTPRGPKTPAVYNLVTHPKLQWNTLWVRKHSYDQLVDKAAFKLFESNTEAQIVVELDNDKLKVLLNSAVLTSTTRVFQSSNNYYIGMNKRDNNTRVTIQTDLIQVVYYVEYSKPDYYLDATIRVLDRKSISIAHGILGQTARPEVPYKTAAVSDSANVLEGCVECYVKGNVGDYIVKDGLFGNNFKYNQYN